MPLRSGQLRIEERALPPAFEAAGESASVERTLNHHARLRALVKESAAEGLSAFAEQRQDHIRFEEQVLFQRAPTIMTAKTLATIAGLYESTQSED